MYDQFLVKGSEHLSDFLKHLNNIANECIYERQALLYMQLT